MCVFCLARGARELLDRLVTKSGFGITGRFLARFRVPFRERGGQEILLGEGPGAPGLCEELGGCYSECQSGGL